MSFNRNINSSKCTVCFNKFDNLKLNRVPENCVKVKVERCSLTVPDSDSDEIRCRAFQR